MRTIEIKQMIDESKYNSFHFSIVLLLLLVALFDGYDLVVYGTVVPTLMHEWNMSALQAGVMGSYAYVGMLVGSVVFGALGDKLGRKTVLVIGVACFTILTGATGLSRNTTEFSVCRLVAGLGLGGCIPNCATLITDYMPKSVRSTMMAIMFWGIPLGGVLAAGLGMFIIPAYGWRTMFYIGALPVVLALIVYVYLPESLDFYAKRNQFAKITSILKSLDPNYQPQNDDKLHFATVRTSGMPLITLFKEGRALSTSMFAVALFMNLLMAYSISVWLPKLMVNAGYSLGSGLWFMLVLNVGAIIGGTFGGWLCDRLDKKRIIVAYFLLASVSITLLGFKWDFYLVSLIAACAGAGTIGTQMLADAYITQYYPSTMRSSGIGFALGVGRMGAMIGPTLGGILVTMGVSFQVNFLAFAIPGLFAAGAIALVQRKYAYTEESIGKKGPIFAAGEPVA